MVVNASICSFYRRPDAFNSFGALWWHNLSVCPEQGRLAEVRIVTCGAAFDIGHRVDRLAQVLSLVVTFYAYIVQRLVQQRRLATSVHVVTFRALSFRRGKMARSLAKIAAVTTLARNEHLVRDDHSIRRVVTFLARTQQEWWVH